MFAGIQRNAEGINRFEHNRTRARIDEQTVIRMNRDTLYSSRLSTSPAAPRSACLITSAYSDLHDLPPLVHGAVNLAADQGFDHSCAPEQGRLLSLLARGWSGGRVGETGTGYGVGLAWLVEAAAPSTSFVSIERDAQRVAAAQSLFAAHPQVRILSGEWPELVRSGPFDLLVLDGGGKGKDPSVDRPLDPTAGWVTVGGTIVLDDFIPQGQPGSEQHDQARRHWLEHPALQATELRLSPTLATIVAVRMR